ncbi:MAG: hypothetical protein ABIY56_10265 [Dokdonella sp.]
MDVASTLLKGEDFDQAIEQLLDQGSHEHQTSDLTELYSASANEASEEVSGVSPKRIGCGMKVCLVSATAASTEAFAMWFQAFLTSPVAKVYVMARHDKLLSNGETEYRLLFSTDPDNAGASNPIIGSDL